MKLQLLHLTLTHAICITITDPYVLLKLSTYNLNHGRYLAAAIVSCSGATPIKVCCDAGIIYLQTKLYHLGHIEKLVNQKKKDNTLRKNIQPPPPPPHQCSDQNCVQHYIHVWSAISVYDMSNIHVCNTPYTCMDGTYKYELYFLITRINTIIMPAIVYYSTVH